MRSVPDAEAIIPSAWRLESDDIATRQQVGYKNLNVISFYFFFLLNIQIA